MPTALPVHRRRLLLAGAGLGLAAPLSGLAACATPAGPSPAPLLTARPRLMPIRASLKRVFDVTVCLRPFRAAGPRLEVEAIGGVRVVHNYGHGGSGWSLSWGSAMQAVRLAMQGAPAEVAVVGCGAIGLTSAILAQEAGAQVTIYARDLLPDTRSARATGIWSPDSRIALATGADDAFGARWEEMARFSFHRYRRYLGLPGEPVEWIDNYTLRDEAFAAAPAGRESRGREGLPFAEYGGRIADLTPHGEDLAPAASPFAAAHTRRSPTMVFNIADYGHTLMADFRAAGGRFVRREFAGLAELGALPQKTVINCPGYGARALCRDESITPVRGQISWLIPQPDARYGVYYDGVSVISRRDGIVVQDVGHGDMFGYGSTDETPDRAETEHTVGVAAELFGRMGARG